VVLFGFFEGTGEPEGFAVDAVVEAERGDGAATLLPAAEVDGHVVGVDGDGAGAQRQHQRHVALRPRRHGVARPAGTHRVLARHEHLVARAALQILFQKPKKNAQSLLLKLFLE